MEITFIFRKFEGYIPSGIGAKSVPVSRQASRQNVISFEILKFSSGLSLQHLACFNEDIAFLKLYL